MHGTKNKVPEILVGPTKLCCW